MKKLSYGRMATARLRAGKKAYLGLGLGIFLSVFLVTSVFLALYGVVLQKKEEKENRVGKVDAVVMDEPDWSDDDILALGIYDKAGHVSVMASVGESGLYFGWPDETAQELIGYRLEAGRLPERPGEIAAEWSALLALELPAETGSEVSLTLTPVDGIPEEKHFTLVGILNERSSYLSPDTAGYWFSNDPVMKFPSVIGSPEEALATGRTVIHRVLGLAEGVNKIRLREAYFHLSYQNQVWAADWRGTMTAPSDVLLLESISRDRGAVTLLKMIVMLGIALLVGSCVAISGSLETLLTERREETGILRAIGATKRQIRRIFGRDALVLCLILMPLSILSACGFIRILAGKVPDMLHFGFSFGLILPVAAVSFLTVWLAQRRPLGRAAGRMPMSVIRDTEMLRRGKKVKSEKAFRIDRLLAKRRRRLFPGRERSSALFMALMIFCSGMFMSALLDRWDVGDAAFEVQSTRYYDFYDDYFTDLSGHALSLTDIAQIRALPHVKAVEAESYLQLTLLADGKHDYLDDGEFPMAAGHRVQEENRTAVRKLLETELDPVARVMLLASDTEVRRLGEQLPEVDREAIDRGDEVLVFAPTWWRGADGHSIYMGDERKEPGDSLLKRNDYFYEGQELDMAFLYIEQPIPDLFDGAVIANLDKTASVRLNLKVGNVFQQYKATLGADSHGYLLGFSDLALITSFEGLCRMGLPTPGIAYLYIYTDGALSEEEEEQLEREISAIARRSEGFKIRNLLEEDREMQTRRQELLLLYMALTAVFFAVTVGLTASGTARKLQSDIRSIGMLRAVGAEEKDLLKSYMRPLIRNACIAFLAAGGLFMGLLLSNLIVNRFAMWRVALGSVLLMAVLAALCVLCSSLLIRQKVKRITDQSIIDNIREL